MKVFVALAILVAATGVSGQVLTSSKSPTASAVCHNCQHVQRPVGKLRRASAAAPSAGGRRLSGNPRQLLGTDGLDTSPAFVFLDKLCPTSGNLPYTDVALSNGSFESQLGQLVLDNGICGTSPGRGNVRTASNNTGVVYGGAAQDFGTYKSAWETYGWSLFKTPSLIDVQYPWVWIQGINLQLIGAVGTGHVGTCDVTKVSFAIFNAQQSGNFDVASSTPVFQSTADVSAAAFSWTQNTTAVLYTDVFNLFDDGVSSLGFNITTDTYYWLRIKVFADLTATKRCFVYWGMSDTVGNDQNVKARWQERAGGASGYSTTCTGANDSPTSLPGQYQTFWNCWNNGVKINVGDETNALLRRCLTFRQTLAPALVANDCGKTSAGGKGGAGLNDFNFALVGYQGNTGAGR